MSIRLQTWIWGDENIYQFRKIKTENSTSSIHELRGEKYIMKASIPGKFPVTLFGSEKVDGRSKYAAILTRDGLGITIINNLDNRKFVVLDVIEKLHTMIVNFMQGHGDILFSADYAGEIIKTQMIDGKISKIGSVSTNSGCANCIAVVDANTVFVGSLDGTIKRIHF